LEPRLPGAPAAPAAGGLYGRPLRRSRPVAALATGPAGGGAPPLLTPTGT